MGNREKIREALQRTQEDLRHVYMTDRVGSAFRNLHEALLLLDADQPITVVSGEPKGCMNERGDFCSYDPLKVCIPLYTKDQLRAVTVEELMKTVDEWLWAMTNQQHSHHPIGSKYRTDQPAWDTLRQRLTSMIEGGIKS